MDDRKYNEIMHEEEPIDISYFVVMGDSLSDRGAFKEIHEIMFQLMGKDKASRLGRFTSGRSWVDHFSADVSIDLVFQRLTEKGFSKKDIMDGILGKDPKIYDYIQKSFNLKNAKSVPFFSETLIRTYCEGGLTADNYSKEFAIHPVASGVRQVISNLDAKRELLFKDDERENILKEQKEKTLVVEWSGANDLVTANITPDVHLAERAIKARMLNMENLIKNGYQNFVLFNLPDLALTPRFHHRSGADRENAHLVSNFFNKELKKHCEKLQKKYPECKIQIFDVNNTFNKVYNNPEQYGFDRSLRGEEGRLSPTFNIDPSKSDPNSGKYLFWDDVHPSDALHKLLADEFFDEFKRTFHLKDNKEIDSPSVKKAKIKAEEATMQQGEFQNVKGYRFEAIKKHLQEIVPFKELLTHHEQKNDVKSVPRKTFFKLIKSCKNLDELAMLTSSYYRKSCFAHQEKLTAAQLNFLHVADDLQKSLCEQTSLFKSGTAHYLTSIDMEFTHFIHKTLSDEKVYDYLFKDSSQPAMKPAMKRAA